MSLARFRDQLLLIVVFVQDIPDDFLQDILHRNKTAGLPIFVDHDHHLLPALLHLPEQFIHIHGFGDELHFPQKMRNLSDALIMILLLHIEQHRVLQVQSAGNIVDGPLKDRKPGVGRIYHITERIIKGYRRLQCVDLPSVRHDVMCLFVVKLEDV